MKSEAIEKAVSLAGKVGSVFVTTADKKGCPHLTAAAKTSVTLEKKLAVTGWFCPATVANVKVNPQVGIIIWDRENDTGYQLLGRSVEVKDLAMLNGYEPQIERNQQVPQVERELIIEIEKVLLFKHAQHTDVEES
jgi:uncharacterized protein